MSAAQAIQPISDPMIPSDERLRGLRPKADEPDRAPDAGQHDLSVPDEVIERPQPHWYNVYVKSPCSQASPVASSRRLSMDSSNT